MKPNRINVAIVSGVVGDGPYAQPTNATAVFRLDQRTDDGLLSVTVAANDGQALWVMERLKRRAQVVVKGTLMPWFGSTTAIRAEAITYVTG